MPRDSRDAGWVDAVQSATAGRGVDVVVDHVEGPMLAGNIRVLALKGRVVTVGRHAGRVAVTPTGRSIAEHG